MIILDTSVWIEFFRSETRYFEPVAALLERREILGLPWVFGELLQGAKNSYEVGVLEKTWEVIPKPEHVVLERAWITAGRESFKGKWISKGVGLIDAAIFSVALELDSKVWTIDKKLAEILRFRKLLAKASDF